MLQRTNAKEKTTTTITGKLVKVFRILSILSKLIKHHPKNMSDGGNLFILIGWLICISYGAPDTTRAFSTCIFEFSVKLYKNLFSNKKKVKFHSLNLSKIIFKKISNFINFIFGLKKKFLKFLFQLKKIINWRRVVIQL